MRGLAGSAITSFEFVQGWGRFFKGAIFPETVRLPVPNKGVFSERYGCRESRAFPKTERPTFITGDHSK